MTTCVTPPIMLGSSFLSAAGLVSLHGAVHHLHVLAARGGDQLGDHPEQLQPPVEGNWVASLGHRGPGQWLRSLDRDTDQHVQGAFTANAPLFKRAYKRTWGQHSQMIGARGSGV